jgi:hypothetical protein
VSQAANGPKGAIMDPQVLLTVSMTILGMVVGGLVGYAIASHYAQRAGEELRLIARAFALIAEEQHLVEWDRDKKGKITFGRVIRVNVADGVVASDGLVPELTIGIPATKPKG